MVTEEGNYFKTCAVEPATKTGRFTWAQIRKHMLQRCPYGGLQMNGILKELHSGDKLIRMLLTIY